MSVVVDKIGDEYVLKKFCPKCRETKRINEFGKDRTRFDLLCPYCKTCRNALFRKLYRRIGDDGRSVYNRYRIGSGRKREPVNNGH